MHALASKQCRMWGSPEALAEMESQVKLFTRDQKGKGRSLTGGSRAAGLARQSLIGTLELVRPSEQPDPRPLPLSPQLWPTREGCHSLQLGQAL